MEVTKPEPDRPSVSHFCFMNVVQLTLSDEECAGFVAKDRPFSVVKEKLRR